jgi:hypothetical protein
MMPVIRVSYETWDRLKSYARPFEDKPEDIVNLALDALDEKKGRGAPPKPMMPPQANALKVAYAARASGAPEPPAASTSEHVVSGRKLPQKEFRMPLMQTLLELGGSAEVSKIRKVMARKMAPVLSKADYQPVSSGEERWWNAICWERADLVREGLFLDHSERGVWELSEKGKFLARDPERSTD